MFIWVSVSPRTERRSPDLRSRREALFMIGPLHNQDRFEVSLYVPVTFEISGKRFAQPGDSFILLPATDGFDAPDNLYCLKLTFIL